MADGRAILLVASFGAEPLRSAIRAGSVELAGTTDVLGVCFDPTAHRADSAGEIVLLWRIEDVFAREFTAWQRGGAEATMRLIDGARALGAAVAVLAAGRSVVVSDALTPTGPDLDHDDPELVTRLIALQAQVNAAFDDAVGHLPIRRLRLAALQHAAGTLASTDPQASLADRTPFSAAFTERVGRAIASLLADDGSTRGAEDGGGGGGLTLRRVELGQRERRAVARLIGASEDDVAAMADDPGSAVFAFRLGTAAVDHGVAGAVIARLDIGWHIQTLAVDQQLGGRGVEAAILSAAVGWLREHEGAGTIRGHDGTFAAYGFEPSPDATHVVLRADRTVAVPDHITLVDP